MYATTLADELLCIRVDDGSLIWSRQSGYQGERWTLNGTPAIAHGVVFFGGLDGTAYAWKAEDGAPLWKTPLGAPIRTSVCALESGIVMGTVNGLLHLLDAEDGSVRSQLNLGKEPSAAIVEVDGRLLVGTDWIYRSSELMCVDSSLSHIAWTLKSPEGTSWSTPRPYVYGDRIFLGNNRGEIFEHGMADGRLMRSTRLEGVIRGIRLADDVLYVGNQDGMVSAIRR